MVVKNEDPCYVFIPDVSRFNYLGKPLDMPQWEIVIKCVVTSLVIFMGVVANSLVILIVCVSKKMRTTINFYIVNLAVADLFVACFPTWIHVTTEVTDGWILGGFICKFNAFVQASAMSAISFTMIAIAGDRFFAIVFPLRSRVTQRKAKFVVVIVWTCAFAIGIPPLLYYTYTERQWANYLETFCGEVWPTMVRGGECDKGATSERVYWTVVIVLLNWLPMVVMTVVYAIIIHRLRCSRMNQSNGSNNSGSGVQQKSTRKVIKMLFTLLLAFMVCHVPFQVASIYEAYKSKTTKFEPWYKDTYFSAILLMYAHSCINPIIYGAMNQTFRQGFKEMMSRFRRGGLSTWESRLTVLDSVRPSGTVNTVDTSKLDGNDTVDNLVGSSTFLNKAVLAD